LTLNGARLSYTLNESSAAVRAAYDLSPGCICTEVQEEKHVAGLTTKKLFVFWVVWPEDKTKASAATTSGGTEDSDDED